MLIVTFYRTLAFSLFARQQTANYYNGLFIILRNCTSDFMGHGMLAKYAKHGEKRDVLRKNWILSSRHVGIISPTCLEQRIPFFS